ncbi:MAG: BatD family protein [Planctomycetota bacterium]
MALLLVSAVAAAAQAERPSLAVSLDRERIYAGEGALYTVELHNVREPHPPDLSLLAQDFDVVSLGDDSLNQRSITIINGRRSVRSFFGHRYRYLLRPKRSGTLTVPALTIEADGEKLQGCALSLEVVEPEEQDWVILDIRADKTSVYPMQAFEVGLRIFVHKLPKALERYTRIDNPVDRRLARRPPPVPALTVPWVDVPEGLQADSTNEWLSPELSRDPDVGFSINDMRSQGDLFSFFEERLAAFALSGRPAREQDVADIPSIRARAEDYWVYTLERRFVPLRPASHRFGPALLKGEFVSDLVGERLEWRSIYAVGRAAHVTVKAVPEEGKPDSFTGGVGEFEIKGELTPRACRVGDPLTLTLTVTGNGNLEEVGPLDLTSVDGVEAGFKIYEATAETRGSARVFTYSLRPRAASVTELPALPFSYFDVERERYVTKHTEPIGITVEEATRLDESQIVATPREAPSRPGLRAAEGLFGNISDPRRVRDESVNLAVHGGYLASLTVLYLALRMIVARWRRLHEDPALLRRRAALRRARERLRGVSHIVARRPGAAGEREGGDHPGSDPRAVAGQLRSSLVGFIADVAALPEAGLTRREVTEFLARCGVDSNFVERAGRMIDACDAVEYGAPTGDLTALCGDTSHLLEEIASHLQRRGYL